MQAVVAHAAIGGTQADLSAAMAQWCVTCVGQQQDELPAMRARLCAGMRLSTSLRPSLAIAPPSRRGATIVAKGGNSIGNTKGGTRR